MKPYKPPPKRRPKPKRRGKATPNPAANAKLVSKPRQDVRSARKRIRGLSPELRGKRRKPGQRADQLWGVIQDTLLMARSEAIDPKTIQVRVARWVEMDEPERFDYVTATMRQFLEEATPLRQLDFTGWDKADWSYFLCNLPGQLKQAEIDMLDEALTTPRVGPRLHRQWQAVRASCTTGGRGGLRTLAAWAQAESTSCSGPPPF
jgi:hypothetical protein